MFGPPTSSSITSNGPCSANPSGTITSRRALDLRVHRLVAHGRRDARARLARELDRRRADAAGAAVHEQPLAGAQFALREDRVVRRREDLRQPPCSRPAEPRPERASAAARARGTARPARRRRRSPSRDRPRRSVPLPARAQRPRRPAPCRGCPAASPAAPDTSRAAASCPRRSAPPREHARAPRRPPPAGPGAPRSRSACREWWRRASRKPTRAQTGRRPRCGASAETCPRVAPCAASSRPRPVRRRWGRAWWGCTRCTRCAWASSR